MKRSLLTLLALAFCLSACAPTDSAPQSEAPAAVTTETAPAEESGQTAAAASAGNIRGNGRAGAIVAGIMPRYAHRKRALRPGAIRGEHNRCGAVGFYQRRRHARIIIGVVNRIHQFTGVDKTVAVTVLICRRQIDIHGAVAHRQFEGAGSGKSVVAHTERGLLPLCQLLNEK